MHFGGYLINASFTSIPGRLSSIRLDNAFLHLVRVAFAVLLSSFALLIASSAMCLVLPQCLDPCQTVLFLNQEIE